MQVFANECLHYPNIGVYFSISATQTTQVNNMSTSINEYNVSNIIKRVKSVRELVNSSSYFEVKYAIYVDGENRMLSVFVDAHATYLKLGGGKISQKNLQVVLSRAEKQHRQLEIGYAAAG